MSVVCFSSVACVSSVGFLQQTYKPQAHITQAATQTIIIIPVRLKPPDFL